MEIQYIQLDNFKRFILNGKNNFRLDMKEPLQLILGTNGSGKSSLLEQLTPMPALNHDFFKGGKKLISIKHNSSDYLLESNFTVGQKHSFIKDNIELNDGGTITVQKQLVEQHFSLTNDIYNLIIGIDTFCEMTISKRKEWFIKLCNNNFDYAIKIYNKLKERHRDISGTIKTMKKRLAIEGEKLVKKEEEEKLQSTIENDIELLNTLIEFRIPIDKDLEMLEFDDENMDNELNKYTNSLEQLYSKYITLESLEVINDKLKQIDMNLYLNSNKISETAKIINEDNNKINILRKADNNTSSELNKIINDLNLQIKQLKDNSIIYNDDLIEHADINLEIFHSINHELIDIFSSISPNEDRKYSQELLLNSKDQLKNLLLSKENFIKRISELSVKITHMEKHKSKDDIICPKCKHGFNLEYDVNLLNKYLIDKNRTNEIIIDLEKQIYIVEKYIDECSEYANLFRRYKQISNYNKNLTVYFSYLENNNRIYNSPIECLNLLNKFIIDLENHVKSKVLIKQVLDKKEVLKSISEIGSVDLNKVIELVNINNEKIKELYTNRDVLVKQKEVLISNRNTLNNINDLLFKIKSLVKEKKVLSKDKGETIRRIHYNKIISNLQVELSNKQHILNQYKIQQSIISDITNQISILEKDEKALSILVKTLSPTEGLIAEGLLGFINNFIEQMNHFINKVWSYSLVIKPCNIDENVDLDYRFPIMVDNNDYIINDISRGSTGTKDVINLAFRIIAMQYLNLDNYPLFLDEWGSGFDTTHREYAINAIKSLINENVFKQLFVISHYSESYSSLSNPQITILDNRNIK